MLGKDIIALIQDQSLEDENFFIAVYNENEEVDYQNLLEIDFVGEEEDSNGNPQIVIQAKKSQE